MEDGPREPHSLDLLWPLPGAQQSVGLPVCPRVAVTAKTQMVAKKTGRRMEVDPISSIAAERPRHCRGGSSADGMHFPKQLSGETLPPTPIPVTMTDPQSTLLRP
ncbi:unnamed protein product [Rangifer tarandus platyrhynchus]|uniref:Uncharacterized protein n=1 Tax=Rangifer tarandus platyrhynchus TaxID=3082113 RepID=A0AC59YL18_RANTA